MSTQLKTTTDMGTSVPSEEELLERARALVPMLRARAEEVERNRSVPKDIVDEFKKAGFFKILQPRRWGGYEMAPITFLRVLMELGRGCCSSAWVMMILGIHQWEFGLMDPRAGDEVWGKDNTVLAASSYATFGKAEKVDGGYRVSGTWRTSSGCDHGDWAFLGAYGHNNEGKIVDRMAFLVKATDYRIEDDWHVFGLAGTGSKSLVVENAFVPDYRAHSIVDYRLSDRSETYLHPFNMMFFGVVSAVIIGFGFQAIDVYTEQMKVRRNTDTGAPVAVSPYSRDRLANAVTKVRSAKLRLEGLFHDAARYVSNGELVPTDSRIRYMLDSASVGQDVEEAVLLLYKVLGARGIFLSNPIQRVLRDTLAAANHITQQADDHAAALGGYLLGQGLPPMLYGLE